MTTTKPKPKDWRNRELSDWLVSTFQQYLRDVHEENYGLPYVTRSHAIEGRWLKTMISEYGSELTKVFIDECFREYKPTPQYPGLSFSFMFTYQRARVLPRVIAQEARRKQLAVSNNKNKTQVNEASLEWL